jgi:hypothetical protein
VLIQIEACLNSRPLCPLSSDINDLEILTPGHFLIGRAFLARPNPDYTETKLGPLQICKLVEKMKQEFWKTWSTDYLCRLQQRPKWTSEQENIAVGELVLIKNDQLPPTKWSLGRIINIHPGPDGNVRVATVRGESSTLKRPIAKL